MVAHGNTKDTHSVGLPWVCDRRGPYMHDILHSQHRRDSKPQPHQTSDCGPTP